jgi:diacylglycerol kinase family enzyme
MESVGSIIAGKPRRVDIGIFNKSHVFIYIAAFGAFTEVAYQTSQDLKNVLGHAAYLIEASKKLMTLRPYRVSVRSEQLNKEGDYIFGMVSNSTSVGGIKNITGNYVKLDDGLFEVTLVRNPRNLWETQEIVNAMMKYGNAVKGYASTLK